MVTPEDLSCFEAAGIHNLIAEAHHANWAQVTDVRNEIQVVKGCDRRQYMHVFWLAQNGYLVSGDYKISNEHDCGFNEEQRTVLGRVAIAAGEPVHRLAV